MALYQFMRNGKFNGEYFESLSTDRKDDLRASYWNHLGAVLSCSDIGGPGSRIQLYDPNRLNWEDIQEDCLRAVWCEIFSVSPEHVDSWERVQQKAIWMGMPESV
jgi:hypothetical protein